MIRFTVAALVVVAVCLGPTPVHGDPCGMLPPLKIFDARLERAGAQRTYVMHHQGVQTMVLRPEFSGSVEHFGMLIPFPSVPALRKVDEEVFAHLEAAIDPPALEVQLARPGLIGDGYWTTEEDRFMPLGGSRGLTLGGVDVLKEEAVGMYEVAVLSATGAAPLSDWMDRHGYRYPDGMDDVVDEYVAAEWVFVAVKTRVAAQASTKPKPGMRSAQPVLPAAARYDGAVQAMGFRYRVEAPVVPMRLSVFNGEDPRNVVYMLTDGPVRIDGVPTEQVVRQVVGADLRAALSMPLPLELHPPELAPLVTDEQRESLAGARDPTPLMRVARELLASDLAALERDDLQLDFEAREKDLQRISETLRMRGPAVEALHRAQVAEVRRAALEDALVGLDALTLTVIDGVFPQELLASTNLTFSPYELPAARNMPRADAIAAKPAPQWLPVVE